MKERSVDKKGVVKALILAIVVAFVCIGVLGWQYRKIEKEKIPALQEQMEKNSAEDVLDKFLRLRMAQDETQAQRYLTERAVEQKERGQFSLGGEFTTYQILPGVKLADDIYRFTVKMSGQGGMVELVEVITLTKILDRYYVDSIEAAG